MSVRPRPLSPHVQIYRPQLTSVLSFSHRLSGIFLSLGALGLALWLIAAAAHPPLFSACNVFLDAWPGRILLFAWTLALYFHLCNGIRHLFWDAVIGFELASIYRSGWLVVAASVLLTLATWLLAMAAG